MSIASLAYVDATGYHYADYPTVLAYFKDEYRRIYGEDTYLEADSQDGQWTAVIAQAVYDCLALGAATYNSFSPSTGQSDALSRNVRLNGIRRNDPSYSNVDLVIIGQAGTTIAAGQAQAQDGSKWNLPAVVTIPPGGSITVNAVAAVKGSVQAAANSINKIGTPTRGWQSVNNPLAAVAGQPVEQDGQLRLRQKTSTSLPSRTVLAGIVGAVANLSGVTRYRGYENDTGAVDVDGILAHAMAIVVEGGDVQEIANTIAIKKTPGSPTFGDVSAIAYDEYGVPNEIFFLRPTLPEIKTTIRLKAFAGYTTGYEALIAQSVTDFYNGLDIGQDVLHFLAIANTILPGQPGTTYDVESVELGRDADPEAPANVIIAFDEAALGIVSNVVFDYV